MDPFTFFWFIMFLTGGLVAMQGWDLIREISPRHYKFQIYQAYIREGMKWAWFSMVTIFLYIIATIILGILPWPLS